jgi:hypothetical protein
MQPVTKADIEAIVAQGFNRRQAKQLAWVKFFESIPHLRCDKTFRIKCKSCYEERVFCAPTSVRQFIEEHKNHITFSYRR